MAGYDYDVGVLGGGSAGLTLASGAAQLGAKVLLIEKEPRLGGDCLHYGCVPSKTLIKSASVYHLMKTSARFGLPTVTPPPVDYAQVVARIKGVIAAIQQHDSAERFCELGAQVRFGQARFVDEHTVDLEGERISAKSWLIATGSSPALPPVPGLADIPYLTNKDIFYLERLPQTMIILGGGPIALEMAQAFQRLGCQVSLVQRSGQVLSKEDQDLADMAMAALQGEGVEFYLNTKLSAAREVSGRPALIFHDSQGQQVELSAEALLVALGRRANLDGLGLGDIGVEFDAKGLKLDHRLRTSHKHIYGAGDVTGGHQFTHAAGYEGGVVLANAVLHLPRKADYTWLPWCTFTEPELASVGMNEKAAAAAGLDYTVWSEDFAANDRALAEGSGMGRIKLILDKSEKPLGVQILGPHAGEIINEWVVVLGGGVKLSTLAGAMHPYPTLGEINKKVAGDVLAPKLFSDLVKKGLKVFFNTRGRACNPPWQEK
ncbi:MAG: FAD-dependent oxidoreductase [Desulfarculaceae bacterium]|nr:FAD-dependent oxidoreductase [Desulfarculaceae bacterium]MCF8046928.1 FAD-dependent oxidoreductase [Desulfarculaceae bacterium]MCF8066792.1 FAD-dependent oxidoreductase [Desulfarculaceae bacterium]MCF8099806.1 FAD-dependent oxidoreductase [Desulfarculaceae bacterium]MCF8121184.1 FAD-dependent oxidoreductase [Desulfarculaceae bacterium]